MNALADALAHPLGQTVVMLIAMAGLGSLVLLMLGAVQGRGRAVARALVGLTFLVVLASMAAEEVAPLVGRVPARRLAEVILGQSGFLLAVAVLIWGAARFVGDTLAALGTAGVRVPAGRWLRVWTPALVRMGAAAALFTLAATLYHENRFPLTFLAP